MSYVNKIKQWIQEGKLQLPQGSILYVGDSHCRIHHTGAKCEPRIEIDPDN